MSMLTPISTHDHLHAGVIPVSPPTKPVEVTCVRDWHHVEPRIPAWRALLERAIWPNPCYSPDFLLPLIKHRDPGGVEFWFAESRTESDTRELVGFMPILPKRIYHLPVRGAEIWRPDFTFDGTPLLSQSAPETTLDCILQSLRQAGYRLLSFDTTCRETCVRGILDTVKQSRRLPSFSREQFERAAVAPSGTIDDYLRNQLSKNRRKKIRRQRERLGKLGTLRFSLSEPGDDFDAWIETFTTLEASGWKGNENSAIASESSSLNFFRDLVHHLKERDEIRFARLTLDQDVVAALVDLRVGNRFYGFKTAYDERFAEYSPGLLIEHQNLANIHASHCELFDACASADNQMLNGLYADRIAFENFVLGLTPSMAPWVNHLMPGIQAVAKTFRRRS
ncbi:MAG: GNAT family N-acetyltransferase [Planctomycetota bacterium]